MSDGVIDLSKTPVHLGLGATAIVQEVFDGDLSWYQRYGERTAADGAEARLVGLYSFSAPWTMWEMHPKGSELVVCVAGRMVLHQEGPDGSRRALTLEAGQAAINAPGVWHTADVDDHATALFVTAGLGTEHRPRQAARPMP